MLVKVENAFPPDPQNDFELRINGPDKGLISAYLAGLTMANSTPPPPEVAAALRDELPVLPFKGGVEKATKAKSKVGALQYLAMWHGLRGDDLVLDTEREPQRTCSKTGTTVLFTLNTERLLALPGGAQ